MGQPVFQVGEEVQVGEEEEVQVGEGEEEAVPVDHMAVLQVPVFYHMAPPGHLHPNFPTSMPEVFVLTFGLKTHAATRALVDEAAQRYIRAAINPLHVVAAVQGICADQQLVTPPVHAGCIFDARSFRPPYVRQGGRSVLPRSEADGHCGWHPGLVAETVQNYPEAWRDLLSQLKAVWEVNPDTVLANGGLTCAVYCNQGEIRSVAVSRVLAVLLLSFPPPGCMPSGFRVRVVHLSAAAGLWDHSHKIRCARSPLPGAGPSRGMCEGCQQGLPDAVSAKIVRDLNAMALGGS